MLASADGLTLAARYGASRSFLGQSIHLAHPYLPRAVAANLLVRREAFELIGGFYEGVRAGEDTDFSWRLQRAGWRLAARPGAQVEHRYRTSLAGLRRQWRGYAAGRAWLGRRYDGIRARTGAAPRRLPRPAQARWRAPAACRAAASACRRGRSRSRWTAGASWPSTRCSGSRSSRASRCPTVRPRAPRALEARVVLVADRFPARGDPLGDFARTLAGARVEAAARPEAVDRVRRAG